MFTSQIFGVIEDDHATFSFDDYDVEIRRTEAVLRFYQRQADGLLGKRHPKNNEGLWARFSIPTAPRDRVPLDGNCH